jgi:hypothetical protein
MTARGPDVTEPVRARIRVYTRLCRPGPRQVGRGPGPWTPGPSPGPADNLTSSTRRITVTSDSDLLRRPGAGRRGRRGHGRVS